MSYINVQGLVNNISEKTTVYTPIIEAIVNSIQSIEEAGHQDGEIEVKIFREDQATINLNEDTLPNVKTFEIKDNGIGFTNRNRDSFDTLYSDLRQSSGGKGFGRFMFLKYFELVKIDSIYQEDGKYYHREFNFTGNARSANSFIEKEKNSDELNNGTLKTIVSLDSIKERYLTYFDKKIETIARNLVEKLLPYFINEKYKCPKIALIDVHSGEKIILNDYISKYEEIKLVTNKQFTLDSDRGHEDFEVKIFKIYFTKSVSSIVLTANNRAVTTESLCEYLPEFKDDFFDLQKSDNNEPVSKNYSIKAYIIGVYLDKHVLLERDDFAFQKNTTLVYPFSRKDIESKATDIVEEVFKDEVMSRKEKKKNRIREYIDKTAPWHKPYFSDLDFSNIPYHFDDETIEGELQKQKFTKEQNIKTKVSIILKEKEKDEIVKKIEEIYKELSELGKSDLAHYVILRRIILDVLEQSLKWNEDKKYEKEKIIHNLIFPMNNDSDHLSYDSHNLWILDERLSFTKYLASDKPLKSNEERPDLLIFDETVAVREGDELSNPITIFEFKRPQREKYEDDEDPIIQIGEYIEKIRKGDFKDIEGRSIKATNNTPAYGFVICDITEKIHKFCKYHSLTKSPDEEGYFGFHTGFKIYIEVISFDKLIQDSKLRNKIFFKKLGIN